MRRSPTMPTDAPYYIGSRYDPNGPALRLAPGQPYNRSSRRTPPQVRGAALLIHGLSDSPYSMQNVADVLFAHGFEVTILRLPGHGTLPSGMVHMQYEDWVAAMHVAARDISARLPKRPALLHGGLLDRRHPVADVRARRDRTRRRRRRCARRHESCSSPLPSNSRPPRR